MNDIALTPAASTAAATDIIKSEVRTIVVTGPDLQALLSAVSVDMEVVPLMDIDSDEMAAELQQCLGRLATVSAAIEDERTARKKPLLDVGRWLDDGYNPARQSVVVVLNKGKDKLVAWGRVKAESARKAREAAEALARENARIAAEAEAKALAAAQETVKAAAEAAAAGSEQVAQAMETQAMVQVDTARQNAAAAVMAMNVRPLSAPETKVKGQRTSWKGECFDKAALLQHIGEQIAKGDKSLMNLVEIDPKAINSLAKLMEVNLKVPGLRAYPDTSVSIRKAAVATPGPA